MNSGARVFSSRCKSFLFILLSIPIENAQSKTVALWLFDEPINSPAGSVLNDSSGNGYNLLLRDGSIVDAGYLGHALACPSSVADYVAGSTDIGATPLNLGNRDWTLEWWQKRLAPNPAGEVDWTYLLVDLTSTGSNPNWQWGYQTVSRFAGVGLWSHETQVVHGAPLSLNLFVDKFDEVHRLSLIRDVHNSFYQARSNQFHHVAWCYDAQEKRLMYFEDGKGPFYVRDGHSIAPGNQTHCVYGLINEGVLEEYPANYDVFSTGGQIGLFIGGQNLIGPDRDHNLGLRKTPEGYQLTPRPHSSPEIRSLIGEMRVSTGVLYRSAFTPPVSLAGPSQQPRLSLDRRTVTFRLLEGQPAPSQTLRLTNPGDGTLAWRSSTDAGWLMVEPSEGKVDHAGIDLNLLVDTDRLYQGVPEKAEILITPEGTERLPLTISVAAFVEKPVTAQWLFDEPEDSPTRFQLEDQTVHGHDLTLAPGGQIVSCENGCRGLKPGLKRYAAAVRRNIDPSHLNLGDFDWTWECRYVLSATPSPGDVLFMMRESLRHEGYPRYTGLGPATGLMVGEDLNSLRFVNERSGTDESLPIPKTLWSDSGKTHHLALTYSSATHTLTLFTDGKFMGQEELARPMVSFESTGENNLSIACSIEGRHAFPAVFDEMQFSATCRYREDFDPDESTTRSPPFRIFRPGPHLLLDPGDISKAEGVIQQAQKPEYPVIPPLEGRTDLTSQLVDWGREASQIRFMEYRYALAHSEEVGVSGILMRHRANSDQSWTEYVHNPVMPYAWVGTPGYILSMSDISAFLRDPATGLLVCMGKTYPMPGENPDLAWYRDERWNYQNRAGQGFRRLVSMTTTRDGIHWANMQRIFVPDDLDDGETQFHVCMPFKRGDRYLSHLSVYRDDLDRSVGWTVIANSHDLYHWYRSREPFVDYGHEPTRGDKLIIAGREVFTVGEWLYLSFQVGGSHKPPRKWFSTYARLPVDRFVEWSAEERGILELPPTHLEQDIHSMTMNARTAEGGFMKVRIQAWGTPPGEEVILAESEPIVGDSLQHQVIFTDGKSLSEIASRSEPVQFIFELHKAGVFSFDLQ